MKKDIALISLALLLPLISSCSYNPFYSENHTTGSAAGAAIGAGVGAGGVALLGGSKPLMVLAGLGGGAVGYYVTTLRYDSGGVIQGGGQVYKVGDYIGIYIPTDSLFDSNTADFLPRAKPILDSAVTVLQRYPDNNIIISGNTSGFYRSKWEQRLSEERAKKVSAYLWNAGVNQFQEQSNDMRKLNYVGYGDYFPIASDLHNDGIRANSRIQITSYPSDCDLELDKRHVAMRNFGAYDDTDDINNAPSSERCYKGEGKC